MMGMHIGVTWRIRLNRPCAAAMRPFCQITLTTCHYFKFTDLTLQLRIQTFEAKFNAYDVT